MLRALQSKEVHRKYWHGMTQVTSCIHTHTHTHTHTRTRTHTHTPTHTHTHTHTYTPTNKHPRTATTMNRRTFIVCCYSILCFGLSLKHRCWKEHYFPGTLLQDTPVETTEAAYIQFQTKGTSSLSLAMIARLRLAQVSSSPANHRPGPSWICILPSILPDM